MNVDFVNSVIFQMYRDWKSIFLFRSSNLFMKLENHIKFWVFMISCTFATKTLQNLRCK